MQKASLYTKELTVKTVSVQSFYANSGVKLVKCTNLYYNLRSQGTFHHILFIARVSSVNEKQGTRAWTEAACLIWTQREV